MLCKFDCVVVPGFGGFVSNYQPAKLLPAKKIILPPSKSLLFNVLLRQNDGLLVLELVLKFQFTHSQAMCLIQREVGQWLALLTESKSIELPKIGLLSKNKAGALVLIQDRTQNLLEQSYGLGVIKAQRIAKEGISDKIKEGIVQRQTSPVYTQNVKKVVARLSAAAVFLILFTWTYINFDSFKNQANQLGIYSFEHKSEKHNEGSFKESSRSSEEEVHQNTAISVDDTSDDVTSNFSKNKANEVDQVNEVPSVNMKNWLSDHVTSTSEAKNYTDSITLENMGVAPAEIEALHEEGTYDGYEKSFSKEGVLDQLSTKERINQYASQSQQEEHEENQKEDYQEYPRTVGDELTRDEGPQENFLSEESNSTEKIDHTKVDEITLLEADHLGKYVVVAGCFRSGNNAENFVKELKSLGYDAQLSGYSSTGLYMVIYGSYQTRSNALKSMSWIQSTHNDKAWMTTR